MELKSGTLVWQKPPGEWVHTVVCKVTYDVVPGTMSIADRQLPIERAERFIANDPQKGIAAPSDLTPFKARADVFVAGHAFAPQGSPPRITARIVVGDHEKTVEVAPHELIPPRACDQSIDEIRSDTRVLLENLHPDIPRLMTRLPGFAPRAWVQRNTGSAQEIELRADTLFFDTDRAIATLTWRGQVSLAARDEPRRITVGSLDRTFEPKTEEWAGAGASDNSDETIPPVTAGHRRNPLPFTQPVPAPNVSWPNVKPFAAVPISSPAYRMPSDPAPPLALPPRLVTPIRDVVPVPRLVDGAAVGVLASSNAAADAVPRGDGVIREVAPHAVRAHPKEAFELVWYEPTAVPRIRRHPAWKKIISGLKPRPSDDDFEQGMPDAARLAAKDKREVLGVLARGDALGLEGVRDALSLAVLDDGSFVPPFVLVAGALEMFFDEMEVLKAYLIAVAPWVPADKRVKEAVDQVNEVLKTPGIERARKVVAALTEKVRAAFTPQGKGVPANYLDDAVMAIVVDARAYQKTTAFGDRHLRCALTLSGASAASPALILESAERVVPQARRFEARVIAEARSIDANGAASPIELRIVALARRMGGSLAG